MYNSNNLLLNMLDTLLLKFQYDSNFKLVKKFVDLNELIIDLTNKFKPQFVKKNISLNLQVPFKKIILYADKLKLKLALSNIISNSIKFNKKNGFVKICISIKNDFVTIKIQNSGIGINSDKINSVFDQFVNNSNCCRKPGTGVSLYISRKIIKAHNGIIEVTSVPNSDTTFVISLPLYKDNFANN